MSPETPTSYDIYQSHLHHQESVRAYPGSMPFDGTGLSYISHGKEHQVYSHDVDGNQYVIKKSGDLHLRAQLFLPDYYKKINRFGLSALSDKGEFESLKKIYGQRLLDTQFVHGHDDLTGEPTNFQIQPFIQGKMLDHLVDAQRGELWNDTKVRSHMLDILWASKKATSLFSMPPDVKLGNIMIEDETRDLLFIDALSSSKLNAFADYAFSHNKPLLAFGILSKYIHPRLDFISRLTSTLAPTEEEVSHLDNTFDVTDTEYLATIQKIEEEYAMHLPTIPFSFMKEIGRKVFKKKS